MTKADTVQDDHQYWIDILSNKSRYLLLGYFAVTLSRSSKQAEHSHENIREIEKRFFGKKPWSQVDKSRLGVPKLVEYLSLRLSKMIRGRY